MILSNVQNHEIFDSKFGKQTITTSNYPAEIENFQYLEEEHKIKYNLLNNFAELESNQIPDLRMSLLIPKTFSPFLTKDISVFFNEFSLAKQFAEIQDLDENTKSLHFVLPSQILVELIQKNDRKDIEIVITPTHPDSFSHITINKR